MVTVLSTTCIVIVLSPIKELIITLQLRKWLCVYEQLDDLMLHVTF